MAKWKYLLIGLVVTLQLLAPIFFIFKLPYAFFVLLGYLASIVVLVVILIMERRKEKKEEDGNDYRDY
ncbi:hypothetical protein [Ammoniphilus sp. YIM 78166]|uniref:hypothetical protein n=1 Tax=Ammoniphilus sp. YIM 78166 TaxID=1644106 RepID=UPI00106FB078|nr:hypothetical protein [Ammoniphilus sp. YIM 78166]